ncbi:hypothetical protein VUR80DRAFT_8277 [Thermomyces stellatus]
MCAANLPSIRLAPSAATRLLAELRPALLVCYLLTCSCLSQPTPADAKSGFATANCSRSPPGGKEEDHMRDCEAFASSAGGSDANSSLEREDIVGSFGSEKGPCQATGHQPLVASARQKIHAKGPGIQHGAAFPIHRDFLTPPNVVSSPPLLWRPDMHSGRWTHGEHGGPSTPDNPTHEGPLAIDGCPFRPYTAA